MSSELLGREAHPCNNRPVTDAQAPSLLLRLAVGTLHFIARWEDAAPETSAALQRAFPISSRAVLDIWSGDVATIPVPDVQAPLENATAHPWLGQLIYMAEPARLLIVFGGCALRDDLTERVGAHIATIVDGLDALAELGERLTYEGAQAVTINAVAAGARAG